mmetsp:Transcript_29804/g.69178  ORF Transcript_29804/g.69178 Transcript_29804/m.69178 type:complete len:361 (+) Transcript_29804:445-1527(+)
MGHRPSSVTSSRQASRISAWSCPPRPYETFSAPSSAATHAATGCSAGRPPANVPSGSAAASAASPGSSFFPFFPLPPAASAPSAEGSSAAGGVHARSAAVNMSTRHRSWPTSSSSRARVCGDACAVWRSMASASSAARRYDLNASVDDSFDTSVVAAAAETAASVGARSADAVSASMVPLGSTSPPTEASVPSSGPSPPSSMTAAERGRSSMTTTRMWRTFGSIFMAGRYTFDSGVGAVTSSTSAAAEASAGSGGTGAPSSPSATCCSRAFAQAWALASAASSAASMGGRMSASIKLDAVSANVRGPTPMKPAECARWASATVASRSRFEHELSSRVASCRSTPIARSRWKLHATSATSA